MADKKVGMIGDYDSICGFGALGIDVFDVSSVERAETVLKNLIQNDYGIIFITEQYAALLHTVLDQYRTQALPAIVPIPPVAGSNGFGISYVKKAVEQAVGSDIIFND